MRAGILLDIKTRDLKMFSIREDQHISEVIWRPEKHRPPFRFLLIEDAVCSCVSYIEQWRSRLIEFMYYTTASPDQRTGK